MPTRREAAQQRNAVRQQARQELADLLGVSRREVEYPHSNRELEETRNRIQVIRNRINREVQELNEARVQKERKNDDYEVRYNLPFKSRNTQVFASTNLDEIYDVAIMRIDEKIDKLTLRGSGWIIVAVTGVFIEVIKYMPPTASGYIPLPKGMPTRQNGVINIQNNDEKCFMWSVLAQLYPASHHQERVSHYKQYENEL